MTICTGRDFTRLGHRCACQVGHDLQDPMGRDILEVVFEEKDRIEVISEVLLRRPRPFRCRTPQAPGHRDTAELHGASHAVSRRIVHARLQLGDHLAGQDRSCQLGATNRVECPARELERSPKLVFWHRMRARGQSQLQQDRRPARGESCSRTARVGWEVLRAPLVFLLEAVVAQKSTRNKKHQQRHKGTSATSPTRRSSRPWMSFRRCTRRRSSGTRLEPASRSCPRSTKRSTRRLQHQ